MAISLLIPFMRFGLNENICKNTIGVILNTPIVIWNSLGVFWKSGKYADFLLLNQDVLTCDRNSLDQAYSYLFQWQEGKTGKTDSLSKSFRIFIQETHCVKYVPVPSVFLACAEGRLLMISPYPWQNEKIYNMRQRCLQLNDIAAEICKWKP